MVGQRKLGLESRQTDRQTGGQSDDDSGLAISVSFEFLGFFGSIFFASIYTHSNPSFQIINLSRSLTPLLFPTTHSDPEF